QPVGARGREHRNADAAAVRSDPRHRTRMLAENYTGDVRAMPPCLTAVRDGSRQRVELGKVRPAEAGVRQIDWPVQNRHADLRIAKRLGPELRHPRYGDKVGVRTRQL